MRYVRPGIEKHVPNWDEEISQDDSAVRSRMPWPDSCFGLDRYQEMLKDVYAARQTIQHNGVENWTAL